MEERHSDVGLNHKWTGHSAHMHVSAQLTHFGYLSETSSGGWGRTDQAARCVAANTRAGAQPAMFPISTARWQGRPGHTSAELDDNVYKPPVTASARLVGRSDNIPVDLPGTNSCSAEHHQLVRPSTGPVFIGA
jgi:hypothetical protein